MPRPNLVVILTDQQRADTLEAYGNGAVAMPALNALAARSVVFERAYTTQPACSPARSAILTGLYPHASGCTANNLPMGSNALCLPERLPRGLWATAYYGKWHLGDEIFPQHGFDEWVSVEDRYAPYYTPLRDPAARSDYHHFLLRHGREPQDGRAFTREETARLPEELTKPAFLAGQAEAFIARHRDRPFVLFVSTVEPHDPYTGPRDAQYKPAEVRLPANFNDVPGPSQPLKARLLRRYYEEFGAGLPLRTEGDWRIAVARYWGLCSLVDAQVGRILKSLEDAGVMDRTIVLFTSDHGDLMGSHRLVGRCAAYEEALLTPLLVHLPGQRQRREVSAPVSQIDLLPTLMDLLGQPLPEDLQGASLRRFFNGQRLAPNDVVVEWTGGGAEEIARAADAGLLPKGVTRAHALASAVADGRTLLTADGWKFSWNSNGEHELYHLAHDPLETREHPRSDERTVRMREFAERIRRWQDQVSDPLALPAI